MHETLRTNIAPSDANIATPSTAMIVVGTGLKGVRGVSSTPTTCVEAVPMPESVYAAGGFFSWSQTQIGAGERFAIGSSFVEKNAVQAVMELWGS